MSSLIRACISYTKKKMHKKIIKKLAVSLSWLNDLYYYFFFPQYFQVMKNAVPEFYHELIAEIESNDVYAERMDRYVQATWQEQLRILNFKNKVPLDFLIHPVSRRMFFKSAVQIGPMIRDIQRRSLETQGEKWSGYRESKFGLFFGYFEKLDFFDIKNISPNVAAMYYHLFLLDNFTSIKEDDIFLEFGGGYGSLASIIYQSLGGRATYVIIDLPEMLTLQYGFLSAEFGQAKINKDGTIVSGKINLIPVYKFADIPVFSPDWLISTFALTESTRACQEDMKKKKYFEAKNVYLAGHEGKADDTWDSMAFTENEIQNTYKTFIKEEYPQPDCFQLYAK